MVRPLSRVGAENREDSRSQRGGGTGLPRSRGLSACTGLQGVGAAGGAFLSLQPKPVLFSSREFRSLCLSVWFSPQIYRVFSGT